MLTNDQKLLIREWVAAGKKNREIIRLAAEHDPPFVISGANISKNFRKGVEQQTARIRQEEREEDVLRAGLAVKEERIRMLDETARYLYRELKKIPVSRANQLPGFVNAMRGCLDDIAKELGQRSSKVDVNGNVYVQDIQAIVKKLYGE